MIASNLTAGNDDLANRDGTADQLLPPMLRCIGEIRTEMVGDRREWPAMTYL